ncbi:molybdenum ABC transporter ATP-binding protein [Consotaella aegiceratis]|uniref:molybdenum ABC transporter ATP-binding protein n=1 Tax=Consotaella aegiceratis TaxID=3097961 RepID=UPI002F3E5553
MSPTDRIEAAFRGRLGSFALDAAFEIPARGVTALFGPSGCGKTSVLRCLAGLQRVADGVCRVGGDVWQDATTFRPTHLRPIGYVFQEPSLFAHLSVRRNLTFGAPRAPAETGNGVGFREVVELLGIAHLLDRAPERLSGGERQRVAIGRALLSQPRLLLMDEPLSALDIATKQEIMPFLERLHAALAIPVVYVSHDIAEVERLADHLILMESGRVIAAGALNELQSDPSLPLALARDAAVSLDATVESYETEDGLMRLTVKGGRFLVPSPPGRPGETRRLSIVAGDVSLTLEPAQGTTILNILPCRILRGAPRGEHEMVALLGLGPDGDGDRLLSRMTRRSWHHLDLAEGKTVYAQVKGVALR